MIVLEPFGDPATVRALAQEIAARADVVGDTPAGLRRGTRRGDVREHRRAAAPRQLGEPGRRPRPPRRRPPIPTRPRASGPPPAVRSPRSRRSGARRRRRPQRRSRRPRRAEPLVPRVLRRPVRQPLVRELPGVVAAGDGPRHARPGLGRGLDVGERRRGRPARAPARRRVRGAPRRHRRLRLRRRLGLLRGRPHRVLESTVQDGRFTAVEGNAGGAVTRTTRSGARRRRRRCAGWSRPTGHYPGRDAGPAAAVVPRAPRDAARRGGDRDGPPRAGRDGARRDALRARRRRRRAGRPRGPRDPAHDGPRPRHRCGPLARGARARPRHRAPGQTATPRSCDWSPRARATWRVSSRRRWRGPWLADTQRVSPFSLGQRNDQTSPALGLVDIGRI